MKKTIRQREKTARKIKKGTRASPGTRSSKGPIAKTARPKVSMKRSEKSPPEQTLDSREQSELFEKAIALFHERNFRKAKALFEKAGAGPVLEVAHSARTHARICEHRIDRAAPSLVSAEDYYNYGVALLNQGDLDGAEKHLAKAISMAPKEDHPYYALALCYGLKGESQNAYTNLKRAIELQPRNRFQARSDPDFVQFIRQPLFEQLLFPEQVES
jgi:tetratricopeptide (TPR) repeat protein